MSVCRACWGILFLFLEQLGWWRLFCLSPPSLIVQSWSPFKALTICVLQLLCLISSERSQAEQLQGCLSQPYMPLHVVLKSLLDNCVHTSKSTHKLNVVVNTIMRITMGWKAVVGSPIVRTQCWMIGSRTPWAFPGQGTKKYCPVSLPTPPSTHTPSW